MNTIKNSTKSKGNRNGQSVASPACDAGYSMTSRRSTRLQNSKDSPNTEASSSGRKLPKNSSEATRNGSQEKSENVESLVDESDESSFGLMFDDLFEQQSTKSIKSLLPSENLKDREIFKKGRLRSSKSSTLKTYSSSLQPEDVSKVFKIISHNTNDFSDSKPSTKSFIKTYSNPRKSANKNNINESFGLPDTAIVSEKPLVDNIIDAEILDPSELTILDVKYLNDPWEMEQESFFSNLDEIRVKSSPPKHLRLRNTPNNLRNNDVFYTSTPEIKSIKPITANISLPDVSNDKEVDIGAIRKSIKMLLNKKSATVSNRESSTECTAKKGRKTSKILMHNENITLEDSEMEIFSSPNVSQSSGRVRTNLSSPAKKNKHLNNQKHEKQADERRRNLRSSGRCEEATSPSKDTKKCDESLPKSCDSSSRIRKGSVDIDVEKIMLSKQKHFETLPKYKKRSISIEHDSSIKHSDDDITATPQRILRTKDRKCYSESKKAQNAVKALLGMKLRSLSQENLRNCESFHENTAQKQEKSYNHSSINTKTEEITKINVMQNTSAPQLKVLLCPLKKPKLQKCDSLETIPIRKSLRSYKEISKTDTELEIAPRDTKETKIKNIKHPEDSHFVDEITSPSLHPDSQSTTEPLVPTEGGFVPNETPVGLVTTQICENVPKTSCTKEESANKPPGTSKDAGNVGKQPQNSSEKILLQEDDEFDDLDVKQRRATEKTTEVNSSDDDEILSSYRKSVRDFGVLNEQNSTKLKKEMSESLEKANNNKMKSSTLPAEDISAAPGVKVIQRGQKDKETSLKLDRTSSKTVKNKGNNENHDSVQVASSGESKDLSSSKLKPVSTDSFPPNEVNKSNSNDKAFEVEEKQKANEWLNDSLISLDTSQSSLNSDGELTKRKRGRPKEVKKRGRPRKIHEKNSSNSFLDETVTYHSSISTKRKRGMPKVVKKRGRPRKIYEKNSSSSLLDETVTDHSSILTKRKRGRPEELKKRGRPRKIHEKNSSNSLLDETVTDHSSILTKRKRGRPEELKKRGRPRKIHEKNSSNSLLDETVTDHSSILSEESLGDESKDLSINEIEPEKVVRKRGRPRKVIVEKPASQESDLTEKLDASPKEELIETCANDSNPKLDSNLQENIEPEAPRPPMSHTELFFDNVAQNTIADHVKTRTRHVKSKAVSGSHRSLSASSLTLNSCEKSPRVNRSCGSLDLGTRVGEDSDISTAKTVESEWDRPESELVLPKNDALVEEQQNKDDSQNISQSPVEETVESSDSAPSKAGEQAIENHCAIGDDLVTSLEVSPDSKVLVATTDCVSEQNDELQNIQGSSTLSNSSTTTAENPEAIEDTNKNNLNLEEPANHDDFAQVLEESERCEVENNTDTPLCFGEKQEKLEAEDAEAQGTVKSVARSKTSLGARIRESNIEEGGRGLPRRKSLESKETGNSSFGSIPYLKKMTTIEYENLRDVRGNLLNFQVGDIAWAQIGPYPYWPCMITEDLGSGVFVKNVMIKTFNRTLYHVRFFGDNGKRAWISKHKMMVYNSKDDLGQIHNELKVTRKIWVNTNHFVVKFGYRAKWTRAVNEAELIKSKTAEEKLRFFEELAKDAAAKKKSKSDKTTEQPRLSNDSECSVELALEKLKEEVEEDHQVSKEAVTVPEAEVKKEEPQESVKQPDDLMDTSETDSKSTIDSLEIFSSNSLEAQQALFKRNNLFKGISKEKVCQHCFKSGDVLKCRGCNGVYHIHCAVDVLQEKKEGRKSMSPLEEKEVKEELVEKGVPDSDADHDDHVQIITVPSSLYNTPPKKTFPPDIENLSLAEQIDYKMKEIMSKFDDKTTYYIESDSNTDETLDIPQPLPRNELFPQQNAITQATSVGGSVEEKVKNKSSRRLVIDEPRMVGHVTAESAIQQGGSSGRDGMISTKHVTADCVQQSLTEKHVTADYESTDVSENSNSTSSHHSNDSKPFNATNFKCGFCIDKLDPYCFVCGHAVSKKGSHIRQKCSLYQCGRFYHPECLKLWPQTQWSLIQTTKHRHSQQKIDSFVCPQHVCHTCASDDPRAATARCSGDKVVKCLRCPSTYHSTSLCVPAGSDVLSATQIVCPRHRNRSKVSTINTTWCFLCSQGGNLICCETCPTSVHPECMHVNLTDDDKFICEDCETGRLPLYDEIVWVKLGRFRWWPALILFPNEVPENVAGIRHSRGEFVVKFFGTYDHYWVNRGRSFLFQDGDTVGGGVAGRKKRNVEAKFRKAVEEAVVVHKLKKEFKRTLEAESLNSLKPPPYIRIKINKPVGNVRQVELDLSNTTACECDPRKPHPCGPDSDCLNRLLLTECNPEVCPAGKHCKNQSFEKREYPPLIPYKTPSRGWGLKCLAPIKKGQFVIEYVGEIIDDEEYQRRIQKMHEQKEENYYFLTIDKDRMIDAGPKGNVARFMNHCCQPNCETQKWTVNGNTRVGLFATEDIPAETELTFNYNLECIGEEKKICRCGAPNCSGFIGVKAKQDIEVKKPKKSYKKKEPEKPLALPACFICRKRGSVLACNNKICNKAYHFKCLNITEVPEANKFVCPWHNCKICLKRTIRCCVKCINSFCPPHSEGNIRYDNLLGFVCSNHDPFKTQNEPVMVRKRRNNIITEESVVTSTTSDNSEDVLDEMPLSFRFNKQKRTEHKATVDADGEAFDIDCSLTSTLLEYTTEQQDETVSSATASDLEDVVISKRKQRRSEQNKRRRKRIRLSSLQKQSTTATKNVK